MLFTIYELIYSLSSLLTSLLIGVHHVAEKCGSWPAGFNNITSLLGTVFKRWYRKKEAHNTLIRTKMRTTI